MVDEDEADPLLIATQALHEPVDAVTGKTEDRVYPPVSESFDEHFGCDLGHWKLRYLWLGQ